MNSSKQSHGSRISFVLGTNSPQEHVSLKEQIQGFPLIYSLKEVVSCGEDSKKTEAMEVAWVFDTWDN